MLEPILWILFILACVLVGVVILLQEGKGGGLSEAFGGVGQQTFGVKAEGINKFTGWVSLVVIVLAIVITRVRSGDSVVQFADPVPADSALIQPVDDQPADAQAGGAPPTEGK
ncbi:MAG: preprotein translocase subunit SecG [Planctomycetes bacterium]|nr:preprotein translocase subunit SecG [Planctomycetota bacterium]